MSERKGIDNQKADRHLEPDALAAIETWLATQAGFEGQGDRE